jgi:phosphotransferase system enzyme I (PtsI)
MIGIVVVSHSVRLAEATVELALEMVHGPRPPIAIAAGVADGLVGTDAARVAEAIGEVATPAGTLVFMDLGSAVLSADLALELVGETSGEVRLSGAPFVEGILAAVVRAAGGGTLDEVAEEAADALMAKRSQLGESETTQPAPLDLSAPTAAEVSRELTLVNRDGLHARPAAELVGAAAKFAAQVTVTNLTKRFGPASARSLTAITSLAARRGDTVRLEASGADADSAVQALSALIETGFGEPAGGTVAAERAAVPESATATPTAGASRRGHPLGVSAGRVAGPVALMAAAVAEPDAAERIDVEDRAAQAARIAAAAGGVADSLRTRADQAGGTTVVVSTCSMMAGPRSTLPFRRHSRR